MKKYAKNLDKNMLPRAWPWLARIFVGLTHAQYSNLEKVKFEPCFSQYHPESPSIKFYINTIDFKAEMEVVLSNV